MMQHAARFDQVEVPLQRAEPHDVGLRVFDRIGPLRARLRHRIGEARAAEIDCKHARALELLRGEDRVLPGSAARDENIKAAGAGRRAECDGRKPLAQIRVDACVSLRRAGADPARIRVRLVLRLDRARYVAFDRRKLPDAGAQHGLLLGFADLLGEQRHDGARPSPLKQQRRGRKFV